MNQVADLHDLELIWPSLGPTDVIVTGTFDQWSGSTHLVKGNAGFHGTVKVPWGEKIAYKFIVDGRWQCREDRPQEDDEHGNINNVLRTPEKPVVPDPPARLSIPLQLGAQSDGQDVDDMVTALEFLPPVDPAAFRVPLSIPHITVDGHSLVPTPVSESKLDSAAATEGTVPASVTTTLDKKAPTSYDVSTPAINNNGSAPLPPINGDGEVHDSSTELAIQFTQAEPSSEVPETTEGVVVPQVSAVSQPSQSTQDARDAPPTVEPAAKQLKVDSETAARASTSSDAPSSTSPPKKRRSLLARIKHMFGKHKEKREKKEKNGH